VFEPVGTVNGVASSGDIVRPLTYANVDKWYIKIDFYDKENNLKTFYWGVPKEAYDAYKIGELTPINVQGDLKQTSIWMIILIVSVVIFTIYRIILRVSSKDKSKLKYEVDEDGKEYEEITTKENKTYTDEVKKDNVDDSKLYW
jgi:hypothetical protein